MGRKTRSPLVEAFGRPLVAVLGREHVRPCWRRAPPLGEIGGEVIEQSDRSTSAGLRSSDGEGSFLDAGPPEAPKLLRPKPGVREHGHDRGVAEIEDLRWERARADREPLLRDPHEVAGYAHATQLPVCDRRPFRAIGAVVAKLRDQAKAPAGLSALRTCAAVPAARDAAQTGCEAGLAGGLAPRLARTPARSRTSRPTARPRNV